MIVKMKFISLTGPRDDIDRVTDLYLSKYEIQLENALSELKTVSNLLPFAESNPYTTQLAQANQLTSYFSSEVVSDISSMPDAEVFQILANASETYLHFKTKEEALQKEHNILQEKFKIIAPFRSFEFNLHEVLQYRFIKFRFGRVSLDYYQKLLTYASDNPDVFFLEGSRDKSYVYGLYFVSQKESEKTDVIFKSLHFERIFMPDDYEGTPSDAYESLEKSLDSLTAQIKDISVEISKALSKDAASILFAKYRLEELSKNFDVRKLAACIEDKHSQFYILCGWMSEHDLANLMKDIKDDPDLYAILEDDHDTYFGDPPTKLKNPKVFKPFEMFIHMYGLPAHNEMDPTIFVALTYTFIFGIMFGDVGQGLCLFISGALIYKIKKSSLAGIISFAGLFSTFFGWMFGSFFGFEDIIEAKWIRPISSMTTLPFIGKLNTIFIVAVAFGMGVILLSMGFHIVNAIKAKDIEQTWFDSNGIAGLVFYGSAVLAIFLFMTGRALPGSLVLILMFGIPLLLVFFKEPLTHLIKKHAASSKTGKGMFIVQGFFELFETLLSYFSNTLSFVRIGAFAVSHAAMMEVVLMLAGAESGSPNWVVIILGNLFVCGMEGLIVGIQVLRLEYYEMFSRFYKGTGREFTPYSKHKTSL